mgnify:CR=1 FL=1
MAVPTEVTLMTIMACVVVGALAWLFSGSLLIGWVGFTTAFLAVVATYLLLVAYNG